MSYKVKRSEFSYDSDSGDEDVLRSPADIILEAMFTESPRSYFDDREKRGLEDKIRVLGDVVSRLMAKLLDAGVISPTDVITDILSDCDFEGQLVEVSDEG